MVLVKGGQLSCSSILGPAQGSIRECTHFMERIILRCIWMQPGSANVLVLLHGCLGRWGLEYGDPSKDCRFCLRSYIEASVYSTFQPRLLPWVVLLPFKASWCCRRGLYVSRTRWTPFCANVQVGGMFFPVRNCSSPVPGSFPSFVVNTRSTGSQSTYPLFWAAQENPAYKG